MLEFKHKKSGLTFRVPKSSIQARVFKQGVNYEEVTKNVPNTPLKDQEKSDLDKKTENTKKDKTVRELREEAKEKGLTGYSEMKKQELIERLSD